MESRQQKDQPAQVDYVFNSQFPEAIKVTTNLNDYGVLRSLITKYKEEVQTEMSVARQAKSSAASREPRSLLQQQQ
jgi:hypothetical protein